MEGFEQGRCRKSGKMSSFYHSLYSKIEEVGWEHLVRLGKDLMILSFRIQDKKGRVHVMEIHLEKNYPKCPPSISADVLCMFNLKWSINSRLKDLVHQFREHLEKLQEFRSVLDDIDKSLWVFDSKQPSRSMHCRQIHVGAVLWVQVHL